MPNPTTRIRLDTIGAEKAGFFPPSDAIPYCFSPFIAFSFAPSTLMRSCLSSSSSFCLIFNRLSLFVPLLYLPSSIYHHC